jgi:hypothetical protein
VAGIAVPLSVWYTFKGLRHQWMVLIGVLFLHILFYTGWWAFIDDFIRFTLPVMPIAIIIGAGFIAVLQKWSASSSISLF